MLRVPSNQLAVWLSCTSSRTWPRSCNRTGAPLRYATTSERNAGALCSCPSARTVYAVLDPHSTPVGRLTFHAATASATSWVLTPREASARGSSWMRTAYFCEPNTCTCATPDTVDNRCARNVSAYSSSAESDRVVDVRAR